LASANAFTTSKIRKKINRQSSDVVTFTKKGGYGFWKPKESW